MESIVARLSTSFCGITRFQASRERPCWQTQSPEKAKGVLEITKVLIGSTIQAGTVKERIDGEGRPAPAVDVQSFEDTGEREVYKVMGGRAYLSLCTFLLWASLDSSNVLYLVAATLEPRFDCSG